MGLSDFRRGPARLSRAAGWSPDRPPQWISRVACEFPLSRAIVITPVDPRTPGCLGFADVAFPFRTEGRLPQLAFSGPAQRLLGLWPGDSLNRPRRPFDIRGSRPCVASRATLTASWWPTSFQVWVSHPRDLTSLPRRTHEAQASDSAFTG